MSLNAQWTTFLIAVLTYLITVLPLAIGLLKTYLKVVENRLLIQQRPTEGKVAQLFHQKLGEAGLMGDDNGDTAGSESRASRRVTTD